MSCTQAITGTDFCIVLQSIHQFFQFSMQMQFWPTSLILT